MLSAARIAAALLREAHEGRLVITPQPDLTVLEKSGAASVDLRLGRWFSSLRATRAPVIDVLDDAQVVDDSLVRTTYVPFASAFVLHPGSFVLAVTLEWIRLPHNLSGDVGGKSTWGRHGLSVATATGVHPTFTGCLTLELANIGSVPIKLYPGTLICQLFLHEIAEFAADTEHSAFVGHRRPVLGGIKLDATARRLSRRS